VKISEGKNFDFKGFDNIISEDQDLKKNEEDGENNDVLKNPQINGLIVRKLF
jgi:hypothetical protein